MGGSAISWDVRLWTRVKGECKRWAKSDISVGFVEELVRHPAHPFQRCSADERRRVHQGNGDQVHLKRCRSPKESTVFGNEEVLGDFSLGQSHGWRRDSLNMKRIRHITLTREILDTHE